MSQFIVVMPRVEGNPEYGYVTAYYSGVKRHPTWQGARRHGVVDLDQSDDFLIGEVSDDNRRLLSLRYMDQVRDDPDELAEAASQMGYAL